MESLPSSDRAALDRWAGAERTTPEDLARELVSGGLRSVRELGFDLGGRSPAGVAAQARGRKGSGR